MSTKIPVWFDGQQVGRTKSRVMGVEVEVFGQDLGSNSSCRFPTKTKRGKWRGVESLEGGGVRYLVRRFEQEVFGYRGVEVSPVDSKVLEGWVSLFSQKDVPWYLTMGSVAPFSVSTVPDSGV